MKHKAGKFLVVMCLGVACTTPRTDMDTESENVSNSTVQVDANASNTHETDVVNGIDEKNNFIKSFYTEYITETCTEDGSMPNMDNVEKIKEKYCQKELLTKIKTLDYDPFLNVQDCDVEWLKRLNIKADANKEGWFIVSYSYTDYLRTEQNITIRLKVDLINETYSIVGIDGF